MFHPTTQMDNPLMRSSRNVRGESLTILIIDDHPIVREGIRRLIEKEPSLEVCGEAEDAREALALIEPKRPDLILLDLSLKRSSGFDLILDVKKRLEDVRTEQWRSLARLFADYDALLCPTMAVAAPPVEQTDDDFEDEDADGRYRGLDMAAVFNNVSQCPALSVPSGFTADGLPTGLQIVGRRFDDVGVLRIGKALETARPWSDRRPAV